MTMREEFDAWLKSMALPRHLRKSGADLAWIAWQAAYSTALEAAAQACERRVTDLDYSSREYTRLADAIECALAIRALMRYEVASDLVA